MKKLNKIILLLFIVLAALASCKKDFLNTDDPMKLNSVSYPATYSQVESEVGSIYGWRSGSTWCFMNILAFFGQEHFMFDSKPDAPFPSAVTNSLTYKVNDPSMWGIDPYNYSYEGIKRSNSALESIELFRPRATHLEDSMLNYLKGEVYINRAVDCYYLAGYYSEMIGDDDTKLGICMPRKIPKSRDEGIIPRSSVKATYDSIISDLQNGIRLLGDHTWPETQKGRFTAFGAKALLGKIYVFLQRWPEAEATLKSVVEDPSHKLLSHDDFNKVWVDGNNRYSSEMLLEINSPLSAFGGWVGYTANLGIARAYNTSYWAPSTDPITHKTTYGPAAIDSWDMGFYPDKNIRRYGFDLAQHPDTIKPNPAYIKAVNDTKVLKNHDPRLFDYTFAIWADSISVDGTYYKVAYPYEEGSQWLSTNHTWALRKYLRTKYLNSDGDKNYVSIVNWPIFRLPEAYLLYAEVLTHTGHGDPLEYINKVHRRAYGHPTDASSTDDYASLTSPTKTTPDDLVCYNNPLRYETWAELQGESVWWFDIKRWELGLQETNYYHWVSAYGGRDLVWDDHLYAWPIPSNDTEVSKGLIKQNPGY